MGMGEASVPFGPMVASSTVLGGASPGAHWAELGISCSLFLGSQKNCSFRGSSFTSTGIASYSSLSMLKEPPVPCGEDSVQGATRTPRGPPIHPLGGPSLCSFKMLVQCWFWKHPIHEKGFIISLASYLPQEYLST